MSNPSFAAEQLLELLLQLKKTTPASARAILNGQPQIAYAVMALMVNMNAINVEVFQKVLAEYGNANRPPTTGTTPAPGPSSAPIAPAGNAYPSASSTPALAIPPHLQQQTQRTSTPPTAPASMTQQYQYPTGSNGWSQQPYPSTSQPQGYPPPASNSYPQQQSGYGYAAPSSYGAAPAAQPNPDALAATLSAMPEDQKALIMRVITMTSEQINALPPTERQAYIQLRATLGVPTT